MATLAYQAMPQVIKTWMRRIKFLWERKELGRIIKAIWTTTCWPPTSRSWVRWACLMTQLKIKMIGNSLHPSTVHSRSQPWIVRIVELASSKGKSYNYTLRLGKAKQQVRIHTFCRQIRWNSLRKTCSTVLKRKIMTSFLIWITARLPLWAAAVRGGSRAWPRRIKASQPPPQPCGSSKQLMNWRRIWACTVNSSRLRWTRRPLWLCRIHTERTRSRAHWTVISTRTCDKLIRTMTRRRSPCWLMGQISRTTSALSCRTITGHLSRSTAPTQQLAMQTWKASDNWLRN